ncbi:MAG: DUF3298 and DUF4163 domain-containing protein, partial [Muribaculaceae bacterium]|nr:DUF3298 and DUF4163 domain-containing protein [Muribaculaceae bacterium]
PVACACSGNSAQPEADASFSTDSVSIRDSVIVSHSKATVEIRGLYPSAGPQALLDSTRMWLAGRLCAGAGYTNFVIPSADSFPADGNGLITAVADSLCTMAAADFEGFMADSIFTNYEFSYSFAPRFMTDSILTYSFNGYGYMGGAHGGTQAVGQTFAVADGHMLTFTNSFRSDKTDELLTLIKQGLWEQYFSNDGASSFAECLLIDPDSMTLPAAAPEFIADGVAITYGQYEIACYAAGMPSCILSYDVIRPLLTPETARLIIW